MFLLYDQLTNYYSALFRFCQREGSHGLEPMFEFFSNFGRESGAGPVELEVESAVFSRL